VTPRVGGNPFHVTTSQEPGFENYDIRQAKDDEATQYRAASRNSLGVSSERLTATRADFAKGEAQLRQSVPTLKVEFNEDLAIPELIAPDVYGDATTLTGPSNGIKNAEVLRNFIRQNNSLIGIDDVQANQLRVTADYTNPDGNLSFAHLEQVIHGVPVFRGEVKAGFNRQGEMFKVINNLAPGLNYDSLSTDFGDPVNAVNAAFTKVSRRMTAEDTTRNEAASNDLKVVFGGGDWATTAEKMYFPTDLGVAVPAWRVMIWQPVNAYYVIVDAHTGTMLWRKNLTNDQTQTATYQVYQAPTSWLGVAGNPAPLAPGPVDPTLGTQGPIGTRTNLTVIGNEAPNPGMDNLGWITDGGNITDGNNVEAGLDLVTPNGVDAGSQATGSPNRVFNSLWNPPPGSPGPGDAPTAAEARKGAVIQMFFVMNKYHDALYSFGFTEPARNFQNDNFGRGGAAGDRVSAEGQDSSGTNNANFSAGSDGTRGRMQMFVWTGPTPQRDGTGDAEVIIHEVTHGTSQRLHNNNAGLTANMSGGMGEGWGDFYGHTMIARSTDPLDSVNTTGGYALLNGFGTVGTANYYYGIRRFPKARMSFTGGPMNRPHNPMTFADIDSNQINVTNGAYPAMSGPHISTQPDQVHAAGEIWSSALWEVRCLMVGRLGFQTGTSKVLQYVTDGMKLDPVNPTFLQGRDSIAQSAINSADAASAADVKEGFRIRGMGFSASLQSGNGTPARVTEAFDTPNAVVTNPISFTDPAPGGNNNTFADPGETIIFSVPVTNTTGATINNVTVSANGGPAVSYGSVANGATVTRNIPFSISPAQLCGSTVVVTFALNSDSGPQTPVSRNILIGHPVLGFSENFDGVTAPALPAGWTTALTGTGVAPTTSTTNSSSAPNNAFLPEQTTTGTNALVTPGILVNSASAQLSFKNLFNLENTFDGMVLEISNPTVNAGAFQDIITAGGSFVSGGYRAGIVQSGTCEDPLNGRQAWTGLSGGTTSAPTYIDTVVNLPANANGQTIKLRFLVGSDCSIAGTTTPGARVDTITISTGASCDPVVGDSNTRADFDGDGKSDISVVRGGSVWYLNRSTAGFSAVSFGASGDLAVPGDYDGDGKADVAVFRGGTQWFLLRSTAGFSGVTFGASGDIPVAADYDGDGKTDIAVYRPSASAFFVLRSSDSGVSSATWGIAGDIPVAGDFDGDSKADYTVFRSGNWFTLKSSGGTTGTSWGLAGDKLVPGDYDGDHTDDLAVFRSGNWFILKSSGGVSSTSWGLGTDVPAPGDFDGDGKMDLAVFRNGDWFVLQSTAGVMSQTFGLAGDVPVPARYIP
jgi:hypothetical protein